jgi:hypothetical protein
VGGSQSRDSCGLLLMYDYRVRDLARIRHQLRGVTTVMEQH